jgi:hypothetical protein
MGYGDFHPAVEPASGGVAVDGHGIGFPKTPGSDLSAGDEDYPTRLPTLVGNEGGRKVGGEDLEIGSIAMG